MSARLVPELYVFDLQESLRFYTDVLGFRLLYERKGERFAYLDLEGAQLMIEELSDSSRQFGSAPLERPLGRGLNMQIQISKVDELYERVVSSGAEVVITMEEKWYRVDSQEGGNRQFVVSDPDGYLLRFYTDLGDRPIPI